MKIRTHTSVELPAMTRAANVRASSLDVEKRTLEVVISTGSRRKIRGWMDDIEEEIPVTPEAVILDRLNSVGIVLDMHYPGHSAGDAIGAVERGTVRIENGELVGTLRFAKHDAAEKIFQLYRDDILRSVSVGYDAEYELIRARDREDGGKLDLYRAISWEPYEVSCVTMPADAGAQARGKEPLTTRTYRVLATPEDDMPNRNQTQAPEPAPPAPATTAAAPATGPDAAIARALDQVVWFRGILNTQGHDPALAEALVRDHAGDETAIRKAIQGMTIARTSQYSQIDGTPPVHIQMGAGESDHMGRAVGTAILQRMAREGSTDLTASLRKVKDSGIDVQDEKVSRLARLGMLDLARAYLRSRGVNTDLWSKNEIAIAVLGGRAAGMHTTSDFPAILADTSQKYLLGRLEAVTVPYGEFYRPVDRPNFQTFTMLRASSAPRMLKLNEGGEIKRGTFGESKQSGKLETFARGITISRQMIVNDSLGAFMDVNQSMADAVVENREEIAMAPFIGNPILVDGLPLYSSALNTDLVSVYGAPSKTVITAAGSMMSKQVELVDGGGATRAKRYLNRRPRAWLGAYDQAIVLEELVNVPFVPATMADVRSPRFTGQPVFEYGALAETATKAYFAIDLNNSGLVCGGLEGQSGPQVRQEGEFWGDGVSIAVVDDFYAAIEFRGGVLRCHTTNPA